MLSLVLIVLVASPLKAQPNYSSYVRPGPEGMLIYASDARGNRISDYSYAGYKGGGVTLPPASVRIALEPARGDPSTLGASEPHHRWSTGVLFDHCGHNHPTPILIMNRGSMGSGHGWTTGNSVMWNCIGDPLIAESPPISRNYSIGCKGQRKAGSFEAFQPETYESWGRHVVPASLYLAQLKDRLGTEAVRNVASREQLERNHISVKDQDNNLE